VRRARALLVLVAVSSALAAPAHDLFVTGWVSGRSAQLSVEVDAYDPMRHTPETSSAAVTALRNISRIAPQGSRGVRVRCQAGLQVQTVTTDHEGQARCTLSAPLEGPLQISLDSGETLSPDLPPLPDSPVTVISDLDDTVLVTGVPQGRAFKTFLNATTLNRMTFPDIAPLYQKLTARGWPIVYLSNSPTGLADFLRTVLAARGLPAGPLLLRPLDLKALRSPQTHKRAALEALAADLPGQFLLIGDTGEKDPEIYAAFAKAHPDRVAGIALRDVAGAKRAAAVQLLTAGLGVRVVVSADAAAFESVLP
jgi:phosphatidate phosphatase APP1